MNEQPTSSPPRHAYRGDDDGLARDPDATEHLCGCGLTLMAPAPEMASWAKTEPPEPQDSKEPVFGYARYGESPRDRHFVAVDDGGHDCWLMLGNAVDEQDINSAWPKSWEQARTCDAGVLHPMVAVYLSELTECDQ